MQSALSPLTQALQSQFLLTLFLVVLFGLLYMRLGRQQFFGWWTLAWAAFAVFLGSRVLMSRELGPAALRAPAMLLGTVMGLVHPVLLARGARSFQRPTRLGRATVLGLAAAVAVGTLVYFWSRTIPQPMVAALARGVPRLFLLAAVMLYCAAVFLREARRRPSGGAVVTAVVCVLWGVEQALYGISGLNKLLEPVFGLPYRILDLGAALNPHWMVLDDIWECGIVVGMVLLLLEEQARGARALHGTTLAYRTLVDASPVAIVACDRAGLVRIWNPAAERLFGWPAGEVVGKPLLTVPPTRLDEDARRRDEVLAGRTLDAIEAEHVRRDGTRVVVSESAAPLHDGDARPAGVLRVLADVTQLRRFEEEMRQAQKMEAVGRLAGGVAHDFNNLLTAVLTCAEELKENVPAGRPGHEEVVEIEQAARRAAELVRQLLAFSRRQVLQPRVLDLNAVVGGMDRLLRRLIGADITLRTTLAPDLGAVCADQAQLEQVVVNLVVNARDAMPAGGRLEIATREIALGPPASRPGRYVQLEIADDGIGMDAATQMRIFEPFYTTKEKGQGTGLGLATVYGIVEQSGGYISVDSAPGRGTTFRIQLPVAASPISADEGAAVAVAAAAKAASLAPIGGTVLVAEDETSVRNLIRHCLVVRGYNVLAASNGLDGLRLAEAHEGPLDLLLTDVVMPEMSGPELARRLAAVRPGLRILFVSGYADDALGERGVLGDEVEFLQKPFTAQELTARVGRMLGAV